MAVLNDADRALVAAEFARNKVGTMSGITKADLRAAINAADDWAQSNAAEFNTALPATFRNNATAAQKAQLLASVIERRYKVGA